MSQHRFQAALARLITDSEYRRTVLENGEPGLGPDFDRRERRRLVAVAGDPGLGVTRTLYKGFRLAKILGRLPLTHRLLGDTALAAAVDGFWRQRPALSFYYLEEAIAFCDYLLTQGPEISYLDDIVGYEKAALELQRPRLENKPPPPQRVRFNHDPMALISCLTQGETPSAIPAMDCTWIGSASGQGEICWQAELPAAP